MGKKKASKKHAGSISQVTADEALQRMNSFAERKEKFIASIKTSKDRNISSATR